MCKNHMLGTSIMAKDIDCVAVFLQIHAEIEATWFPLEA